MTKAELINAVASASGLTRSQATKALEAVGNTVACALVAAQEVTVPGLGKFARKEVAERHSHNPQTGEAILVPAHGKATFKPTGVLKESVK